MCVEDTKQSTKYQWLNPSAYNKLVGVSLYIGRVLSGFFLLC